MDLVRGEVAFALIDRLNKHERANRVTFVFRSHRLDQSFCVGVRRCSSKKCSFRSPVRGLPGDGLCHEARPATCRSDASFLGMSFSLSTTVKGTPALCCSFMPLCGGSVSSFDGIPFFRRSGRHGQRQQSPDCQVRTPATAGGRELIGQINAVDAQLIEIESQLSDEFTYPGDPPLGDRPRGGKTSRY